MDFVKGLGDTINTLEIAVDDIGRVEIHNGRVRITFVSYRDGGLPTASVSLVWSVDAYASIQNKRETMNKMILARAPTENEFAGVATMQ